jgi:methionyl-tRNA formyltransferase
LTDKARTIFLGTGAFAVPVVEALAGHRLVELIAVVTAPHREDARGRPIEPPVAAWATVNGIPTFRPARLRTPAAVEHIRDHAPDLLVLADYGQIVPEELLELPAHGALNLHPSLLPRYRGATPIPAAILAGDEETGVTLMRMDSGLDTGPIVAQERVPIDPGETAPQLEARLAGLAAGVLTRDLEAWLTGALAASPQPDVGVSQTRSLRREDGRLDPGKIAAELERQVRAYQPWPGSFIEVGATRLVVWQAHPVSMDGAGVKVGDLYRTPDGGISLRVSDGGLQLDEVQPAGGKRMTGAELVRGRSNLTTNEGNDA